ncbi:hypothetical protein HYQ46_003387 [Verticillium longisporum]|uniref:Clr5 domain-containing protein n=1 Tax=Verticillium longisporum TaxID=100787 RepID=A0A0G4L9R5_VERLO|nr:hypothetical protein HYQ44_016928 [Verticillium longisporum]KAG7147754.1 hypothetical protein HYQ46_003387 [Verticillium longisporum]CRK18742.1 hypothetical protein BN1708_003120 [Verticillium longisporum]
MSRGRHIPSHEWQDQKEVIQHLYYERRLPVQSKIRETDLVRSMKKDHNFDATAAQWHAQLNRWGRQKNLKKEEAGMMIAVLNWLKEEKRMEARPVISGKPWGKARLNRTRRHVRDDMYATTCTRRRPVRGRSPDDTA